ncbi:cystathionine gamma-synthase [Jatrophihabitans sp. GAS493]|uniref:trans-sulfuration enzyme family protein n=1 Tax=Jatrophihabitans sp. GAS493 TaxID=1907575 RepID=UPI000BB997DF|nr:PLP-dependent transferase [Jatrophihabitans sp. GAS493]SOD70514.1 cystathionine gamma-synthase [Jatrophihabitans sp. GAS493]
MTPLHPESIAVHAGRPAPTAKAPLNVGIELSATFHHGPDDNYYLRHETHAGIRALEQALGELEGGDALVFSSGMAATTAVIEGLLPVGSVVVTGWTQYTGSTVLLGEQERLGRLTVRSVATDDTAAVLAALDGASLLWLETPSNPMLAIVDLPVLVEAAHAAGAIVVVDSTFNTPLVLRPLDYGADIVMHSATKYLAGHSDLLMGALITRGGELGTALRARRDLTGALPGGLETYLALRGLRTLPLRMERAQSNAMELATRLSSHPAVSRVRYPGLESDPFHARASQLHAGFGAMISFDVRGGADAATRVCESVRLISHATSLGGVESLIERRAMHAMDAARDVPASLLRFSVGIEHVEDLWDDLSQALRQV